MVFFPVSLSTKLLLSYTKATDSYTLILYSVTLLEIIIRLKCFLVEYFGSCKYIFCHLQIQKVSFQFPTWNSFIYFSYFTALVKTLRTIINNIREIDTVTSSLSLQGMTSSFPHLLLGLGFSYVVVNVLRYSLCNSCF